MVCVRRSPIRPRYNAISREVVGKSAHATKGIVGGFEFSVLQRNWEKNGTRGHGRMFASAKGKH